MTSYGGSRGEVVLSRSDDLTNWGQPEHVLEPRRLVGLASYRHRPATTSHGRGLAGDLPRSQGNRCRHHLSRRSCVDGPRRSGARPAPCPELGPRAFRPVRTRGRHTQHRVPVRAGARPEVGEVRLYYGAADTTICVATAQLADLLDAVVPTDGASAPYRGTASGGPWRSVCSQDERGEALHCRVSAWPRSRDRGKTVRSGSRSARAGAGQTKVFKRKSCFLCKDKVREVDYKNVNQLRRYLSERGKIGIVG